MRRLAIVGVLFGLGGTASAGPVLRFGVVGGYDTSAPGHREDGIALGAGYRLDGFTAQLDFARLEYDGTDGIGGGATRLGALLQARLLTASCRGGETCPHLDLDVAVGRRSVTWQPESNNFDLALPPTERRGRELGIGLSATFGLHFSLHYVIFQPDPGPQISCRGTCPMNTVGDDRGVLFEASYAIGGS